MGGYHATLGSPTQSLLMRCAASFGSAVSVPLSMDGAAQRSGGALGAHPPPAAPGEAACGEDIDEDSPEMFSDDEAYGEEEERRGGGACNSRSS
mmetsp:Transcript_4522/g.15224  ORF Transcript_4522/g.15224 Transcript_4522/m.15224 type:complete len:94 (+) Transcript_4522:2-283(+)